MTLSITVSLSSAIPDIRNFKNVAEREKEVCGADFRQGMHLSLAQLVEHVTVVVSDITWSLVRFRQLRLFALEA